MSLIPQPQRGPAGPAGPGGGGLPLSGVLALGNQSGTNDIEMGIVGTQKAEITNASIIESERIDLVTGASVPTIASTSDITLAPVDVVKILNTSPTLTFDDTTTNVELGYFATGSQFSESALTTSAHEIGVYTTVVGENIAMGVNQALQIGYVTGQGLPLFIGENGANSYASLLLGNGNNPTDFLIIDRKDNTDVTQTACSVGMSGAGVISIVSNLAGGDIGIVTNAVANIGINSGQNITMNATSEIQLQIGGNQQARLAGSGNIGVGGSGSDGSVFLLKNDDSTYGSFYYSNGNDSLNMDSGGSAISVGANEIGLTSVAGMTLTTTNAGDLNLTVDNDLTLTGANIDTVTAGGNSGQFLRIKLNGVYRKINLLFD